MCHGSTALIPLRAFGGLGGWKRPYIDNDQVRTCRDFGMLREWVTERSEEGKLFVPRVQWDRD